MALTDAAGGEPAKPGRLLFAPGETVGCYEVLGLLAEGGFSQVFEARDALLHRVVAIKAAEVCSFAGSLLRKEGQALAAVRHPALVTIHGMGVKGHIEYLVMEKISGTTLGDMLREHGPGAAPEIREIVSILAQVAAGLVAIHGAGIAHRDIKPENIMLTSGGRVVLMDLGIFLPEAARAPEQMMGTPCYMAPESILSRIKPGAIHLVDLYALGVLAFELLAGKPPFEAEDISAVLHQHVTAPVPDLLALRPDAPVRLVHLIGELLAKDPQDRVDSAEVALWRLQGIEKELAARPRAQRILVIDDDPAAADLVEATVRRSVPGAIVTKTGDARAALVAIEGRCPDLILLDLQIPGLNGIELCMYLRGSHLADACPIVAVSARAERGDLDLLARLGVRHFVRKGAALPERLGAAVRAIYAADPRAPE
jgi:eukaryotic-like serine/threonine-protein kinase